MHPHLLTLGPVTIPTFGAVAALGLVLATLLAARGARVVHISEDAVWNLCLFIAGSTLVLSRLLIVAQVPKAFLHYPLYILTLPTVTKYGLLAAVASALLYILFKRLPLLRTADALAPAILLLQATLHLGSLFAGDDLGSPTLLRIGQWVPGDRGYHPVALYSAVLTLLAFGACYLFLQQGHPRGETFGLGLLLGALIRFFIDQFRPGYVLPESFIGGDFLRVDQVVLILLAAAGLGFFFQRRRTYAQ